MRGERDAAQIRKPCAWGMSRALAALRSMFEPEALRMGGEPQSPSVKESMYGDDNASVLRQFVNVTHDFYGCISRYAYQNRMSTPFCWHEKEQMLYYSQKKGGGDKSKDGLEKWDPPSAENADIRRKGTQFLRGGHCIARALIKDALYPAHGNRESAACMVPYRAQVPEKRCGSGMRFRP